MAGKKKRQRNLRRTMILTCAAVLIVAFGALYAASRTFGSVRLSNLADVFDSFSVRDDSRFPYVVDAGTVQQMVPVGSGVGVLCTDRFDILTRSGAVLQSVHHTYTMPAVDVRRGRVLLYDRGGNRYMLLSKTKTLLTGETDEQILTASLSGDGRFAVAVASDSAKSLLSVYTSAGEVFFQYKCVSEYITDIAFTASGAALTVTGVRDAGPYSRLLVLDFSKTEPLADYTYEDTALFQVQSSGGNVTAYSDTRLAILRRKTKQAPTVSFGSDALQFLCADEGGKTTLVMLTYGNEHQSKLRGLKANGETVFETECGQKIKDASRSSSYTSVLTDDSVLTYTGSGGHVGTLTLTQAAQRICLCEHTVFVLFNDHIEAFPAAGQHEMKTDKG